jgi:hypothetical protein
MTTLSKSVKYQLVWRDLLALAKRVKTVTLEEKDNELEFFIKKYDHYIFVGIGIYNVMKVHFDRNMINYLSRNGYEVAEFKRIFEEFARRRYGSPGKSVEDDPGTRYLS